MNYCVQHAVLIGAKHLRTHRFTNLIKRLWLGSHGQSWSEVAAQTFRSSKETARLAYRGKLIEERHEKIFEEFLARCIVDETAKMCILGDISKFSIAVDGSCYNSGASHTGV